MSQIEVTIILTKWNLALMLNISHFGELINHNT